MKETEATHIRQINWAILYSQTELDKQPELDSVKMKLYEFVQDSNLQGTGAEAHQVTNLAGGLKRYLGFVTEQHVKKIQQGFKDALSAFADKKYFRMSLEGRGKITIHWGAFHLSRFFQIVTVDENPVSQAVLALGLHIAESGLTEDRIRRCPNCAKIFVRERKPQKGREQYCSPECAQIVASLSYRERTAKAAEKGQAGNRTPRPK